jgi:hypothetical protein
MFLFFSNGSRTAGSKYVFPGFAGYGFVSSRFERHADRETEAGSE